MAETPGPASSIRAKTAACFRWKQEKRAFLDDHALDSWLLDDDVASGIGQAVAVYRERGGKPHAVLAAALIGARASTLGSKLMIRVWPLEKYLPELSLITPENKHV